MKGKWINMYMDIAKRISIESHAERLKVGAVFVSEEGVMSIGINGLPSGGDNCCEVILDNGTLATKDEVSHAEENLFSKIMRQGISSKNGTIFLTHSPCIHCSKIIVGAGIREVYFNKKYRSEDGIKWLQKNGVNTVFWF